MDNIVWNTDIKFDAFELITIDALCMMAEAYMDEMEQRLPTIKVDNDQRRAKIAEIKAKLTK